MVRIKEPIKVTDRTNKSPMNEIEYSHPSFGLLQISRVTSNRNSSLFGSSIKHQNTIMLRINKAKKYRSLARDWYMDNELPHIEIEMSQAQFAEAITSLNMGSGVPCTVRSLGVDRIEFEEEQTKTEEHSQEYKRELSERIQTLKDDMVKVRDILAKKSLNKADREFIQQSMSHFISFATSSSSFYKEQFDEQMEKTITEAKSEIEAFMTNAIMRTGLDNIKPIEIPE